MSTASKSAITPSINPLGYKEKKKYQDKMTAVNSEIQKLENLLNSATNERQRKMYQALIDKARSKAKNAPGEGAAKSQTEKVDATVVDQKKVTAKSTQTKTQAKKRTSATNDDEEKTEVKLDQIKQEQETASTKAQSQSQSQKSNKTKKNQTNKKIFQAVGVIKCTPYLEDEKLFVTIKGIKYDLNKSIKRFSQQFRQLKKELEQNEGREMFLRVYPNIIHYADEREIRHSFALVGSDLDESKYSNYQEDFIFRGIWQFVPYCPTPVISIYRNINTLSIYKQLSPAAKKFFARPQAFPVVWDAPVEPFVYNPSLQKSEQMPRYFVEVRATFQDGQYTVVEMLNEPSLKIPKFVKP